MTQRRVKLGFLFICIDQMNNVGRVRSNIDEPCWEFRSSLTVTVSVMTLALLQPVFQHLEDFCRGFSWQAVVSLCYLSIEL
jgi:hypothetical protein